MGAAEEGASGLTVPGSPAGRARTLTAGPWRVRTTVRPGVPRVEATAVLVRAIERALHASGAPSPASIGLILTDDAELASLNAAHMGVHGPTDVLSFPLLSPEAYPPHEGGPTRTGRTPEASPFVLPPRVRPDLGEIVVSVERAIAQAESGSGGQTGDVRWSPRRELRLLVTHGTLHICGWDHADRREETAMRRLERELLAAE